jgi:hypothetical protein
MSKDAEKKEHAYGTKTVHVSLLIPLSSQCERNTSMVTIYTSSEIIWTKWEK